jgi:DNA-binding NarL/FixJ family response regulator
MIDSMTAMPIRGQTRQPTAPKAAGPPFGGVVAAGQSVVDPLVVDALATRRARPARSPRAALTPRELDALREMAQGRTNAGIEQALHLSGSSVEKHVASIFAKLRLAEEPVHRRVAAVLAFLRAQPDPRA